MIESDPEVQLIRGDDGKLKFVKDARYFSNLYPAHTVAGKIWGVPKPEDRQFMAAKNGDVVYIFKPAPASACAGI